MIQPTKPWPNGSYKERWDMASNEIFYRLGFPEMLWWKFMPGKTISLKWPNGWVVLHDDGSGGQVSTESADPNDHYRPWLEKNVGKQGWDWQWRHRTTIPDDGSIHTDWVVIKFRKSKEKWATMAAMKWS